MWGKDLVEELQKIYRDQSKCCLLFISKEYKDKIWTRHEKRSVLERAINEEGVYLLPARFDDTEISGIPSTTSYIDISNKTPEDFSKYILLKLGIPLKQKEKTPDKLNLPEISVKVDYTAGFFWCARYWSDWKSTTFFGNQYFKSWQRSSFLKVSKDQIKKWNATHSNTSR